MIAWPPTFYLAVGAGLRNYVIATALLLTACGGDVTNVPAAQPVLSADHYEGVAAFAVQSPRFPCDAMLEGVATLQTPALAFPFHTFGTSDACIKAFVEQSSAKPHLLVIHATNETCRKHNSCTTGDLFQGVSSSELNRRIEAHEPATISTLRQRFADIRQTVAGVSSQNTRVVVSTGLEDEYSSKAAEIVFLLAHEQFAEVAENPEVKRHTFSHIVEVHRAQTAQPHGLALEDGACQTDVESKDFLRRNKQSLASFVWRPEWQGRKCKDGKVTSAKAAPRERSFSFDSGIGRLFD